MAHLTQVLGVCLAVKYLVLGMVAVLVFVLVNTGAISATGPALGVSHTYAILAAVLSTNFFGFFRETNSQSKTWQPRNLQ